MLNIIIFYFYKMVFMDKFEEAKKRASQLQMTKPNEETINMKH